MNLTSIGWNAYNPILGRGKRGEETDTGRYKVGDGVSPWSSLNYSGELPGGGGVAPGAIIQLESNAGGTLITGGLDFDTFYHNNTVTTDFTYDAATHTILGIPAGVYVGFMSVYFNVPDKDYVVSFEYGASGGTFPRASSGGHIVSALAANNAARVVSIPITLIAEAGKGLLIGANSIQSLTADGTITPLTYSYADGYFTKIG